MGTNAPIQKLNLLLKSYTRDLEAFSKLTRRQKKIFHDNFKYQMHENIICNGLSDFDHQLNLLKTTIIKLSESQKDEKAEKFLIDDTKVMALNDDLTKFNIIVSIQIGNNQIWKRITEVHIDEKTKLISFAKIVSIQVTDDPKSKQSIEENNDNKNDSNVDIKNILNVVENKEDDY